jgi:hypothetical protein
MQRTQRKIEIKPIALCELGGERNLKWLAK